MSSSAQAPTLTLRGLKLRLEQVGARLRGDGDFALRDLVQDSRQARAGDLFAARPGTKTSGVEFVRDAVNRGARAIMVQAGTDLPELSVPVLEVENLRLGIALAAEAIHGHPSASVRVIALTGTNGKSTCVWLTQQAIEGAGGVAARLGTLGYACGDTGVESSLTTPEADTISRYLAESRDRGASHFVLEASSHALSQSRVDALNIAVAAFTNLTQDHLDYHHTMESYGAAKARLFLELCPGLSVLNVDDPFGRDLFRRLGRPKLSVSALPILRDGAMADVQASDVQLDVHGIRASVRLPSGTVELVSPLVGRHNLENLLTTLAIIEGLGLDVAAAAVRLAATPGAAGRLERCDASTDDVRVLVDYAHTPDALTRALAAVRELTDHDLVCVFGCGGDRDPTKRPKMGEAVGRLATRAIISNDNPRTEDPRAIAAAIEPAVRESGIPYEVVLDRAAAIERAILEARPGDLVLIAGKGHEDYQIVGTTKRPFDDRVEARKALAKRRARRAGLD